MKVRALIGQSKCFLCGKRTLINSEQANIVATQSLVTLLSCVVGSLMVEMKRGFREFIVGSAPSTTSPVE